MKGIASLANRDFGPILPVNCRKVHSPVPRITQMKPQARAISLIRGVDPQRRDSLAERSGLELPVPILELLDDSSRQGFQNRSTSRQANERPFRSRLYRPFFQSSAQRFFIASDNRFLQAHEFTARLERILYGSEPHGCD